MSRRISRPLYCYITDRHQLPGGSVRALAISITQALSWGVDFVQLREKDLPDAALLKLTRQAVRWSRGTGCRILVNGRLDVALAGGAGGVHLPSRGIDPTLLKPHLPRGFLMGVSTHSLAEACHAADAGADYILLGPVFRTPSKLKYGKPLGIRRFRAICSRLSIPVLGLGGIRPKQVPQILEAGAAGVAGIRLFQENLHLLSRNIPM